MATAGPSAYNNIDFYCDGCKAETVTVTPTITMDPGVNGTVSVETINYGALTTWYKLKNAPKYSQAWRAMTTVADKMLT